MQKPAKTLYPVHALIRERWSPRAFASKPVSPELLKSVLEAARWAASSFNEQPWRYLVALQSNPEAFEQMLGCLVEKNQKWAKGAPVLLLSFYKKTFSRNNSPNRVALHDVGAASAQLTLEALEHGLFVHQMAGIEVDKIRSVYKVPADFEPVAGLAIGYPGEPEMLAAEFVEMEKAPRERKDFKELFFAEEWAKPAF